jgi:hypothetical protein
MTLWAAGGIPDRASNDVASRRVVWIFRGKAKKMLSYFECQVKEKTVRP